MIPLIAAAIPAIIDEITTILNRVIPDKDAARKAAEEMADRMRGEDFQLRLAQIGTNTEEAKSPNWFVAGWRPAIGWVCASSLAVYYIPRFLIGTILWGIQAWQTKTLPPMPEMGVSDIIGLVGTLLGMSVLRTREKEQGVAR